MDSVIDFCIAGALLVSAGAKAGSPASRSHLSALGIDKTVAQWLAWSGAILVETMLAVLLLFGVPEALIGAAALFAGFGVAHIAALRRGAAGQSCGCLGNHGTVSWRAALVNFALAAVALVTYIAAEARPSERVLVIAGFAILAATVLALGVAVAALARELGIVRLALQSGRALEIPDEGPALGSRMQIGRWFETTGREMAFAVFTSAGCPVCQGLGPSVDFIARDSRIAVLTFDEEVDHDAWEAFAAPGAPYAVALDREGTVLAKGVANSLPQLESILATAVRRRAEAASA